jgi:hypothetical protein
MAAKDLSGFNGSVTLPTTHGGAAAGFTVRRRMSRKSTGRYGSDRFSRTRGGMITIGGDIRIFLQMSATNTTPNFIAPAADGSALVLTLELGCTLTGTALFPDLDVNHSFDDPAIEGSHAYEFTGVVAEAWATT